MLATHLHVDEHFRRRKVLHCLQFQELQLRHLQSQLLRYNYTKVLVPVLRNSYSSTRTAGGNCRKQLMLQMQLHHLLLFPSEKNLRHMLLILLLRSRFMVTCKLFDTETVGEQVPRELLRAARAGAPRDLASTEIDSARTQQLIDTFPFQALRYRF